MGATPFRADSAAVHGVAASLRTDRPGLPALRSAQGVHPKREAMPRKRPGFTPGRAFASAADADRASAERARSP
jgi:hypothetical protein